VSVDITPIDIDVDYMWSLFERFVAVDTHARIGENGIAPDDSRLARFARMTAAPALADLGAQVTVDRLNNVVARFGPDSGAELLFVAYPAAHHSNEMADPLRARRVTTAAGEHWVGLGASQGKGSLAGLCAAVRLLQARGIDLAGRVILAVSSEGRSSHHSAEVLFGGFEALPAGAVLVVGTGNRLSLGNRGRVDVVVEVAGWATHSSAPDAGANPIPVAAEVVARVARVQLDRAPHERLGRRSIVPYKLVCGPVAPHTIPSHCTIVFDRRTLPGDDTEMVVAEIAATLDDLPVTVRPGAVMLPALVAPDAAVVRALQAGARASLGLPLEAFYPPYTFDAGYPCSLGVATVMFGPASSGHEGTGILGDDQVSLDQLLESAAVYAGAIAARGGAFGD